MVNEEVFKAYDIRGKYPDGVNENLAYIVGKSYGTYLQEYLDKNKCVIGHDNRLSSESLNKALINGLIDSGINVIDYGLVTTPMHYFSRYKENTYGIMITASHNPKEDNGFKFSLDPLANARGEMIESFKQFTLAGQFKAGKGIFVQRNIKDDYLAYLKNNIDMGDRPLKVVVDCGNGVTSTIVKDVYAMFPNLDVTYICSVSDGTFPNHHPDPAVEDNMQMLKDKVLEIHADLGIAYDGDGDRLGIIDEKGQFVLADEYMIVAVRDLIKTVENKTFLCDVKCSQSLIDEIERLGGKVFMSRTGTSFTEANTKKNSIPLGGELSGHIFFNDRGPEVCSAIYAGLRFLEILSKTDKSFSELLEGKVFYYSTPEIKIEVPSDRKFEFVDAVTDYVKQKRYEYLNIDGVRVQFKDGWALIRASNTGPHLTLRFESTSQEELEKRKNEFTKVISKLLSKK